jgi:hypothetical protein
VGERERGLAFRLGLVVGERVVVWLEMLRAGEKLRREGEGGRAAAPLGSARVVAVVMLGW